MSCLDCTLDKDFWVIKRERQWHNRIVKHACHTIFYGELLTWWPSQRNPPSLPHVMICHPLSFSINRQWETSVDRKESPDRITHSFSLSMPVCVPFSKWYQEILLFCCQKGVEESLPRLEMKRSLQRLIKSLAQLFAIGCHGSRRTTTIALHGRDGAPGLLSPSRSLWLETPHVVAADESPRHVLL